jgi:hypothetical protein
MESIIIEGLKFSFDDYPQLSKEIVGFELIYRTCLDHFKLCLASPQINTRDVRVNLVKILFDSLFNRFDPGNEVLVEYDMPDALERIIGELPEWEVNHGERAFLLLKALKDTLDWFEFRLKKVFEA